MEPETHQQQPEAVEDRQRNYLARINTTGELSSTSYEPRDLPSLMDLANMLARSALVPQALRGKPQDITLVCMRGREMGLTTMMSLQNLHAIYGKVGLSADLMRALCQAHPECEGFEVVEASPEKASVQVKKKGWTSTAIVTFTIEDAKRAGLVKPGGNWQSWPEDMCVARATSRAARRYFPAVVAGLYSVEELRDMGDDASPAPAVNVERAVAAAQVMRGAAEQRQPTPDNIAQMEGRGRREPGGEVIDAEVVPLAEKKPEPAAEAPPGFDPAFAKRLQREVKGVGEKAAQSVAAAYPSAEAIAAADTGDLVKLEHVGHLNAGNLGAWARAQVELKRQKEAAARATPPAEAAEAPSAEPTPAEPPPASAPSHTRPVMFSQDHIDGLRKLAHEYGAKWSEVVDKALRLSGGHGPERLTNDEWKQLVEWVKSAKQEALPVAAPAAPEAEEEAPPAEPAEDGPLYRLVRGDMNPISPEKVAQLLRWVGKTGRTPDQLAALLAFEWGVDGVEKLPESLYLPIFEWAAGDVDAYKEAVDNMIASGDVEALR